LKLFLPSVSCLVSDSPASDGERRGAQIVFRDELKRQPVDVIIIPTQWRARDIVAEMEREGIVAGEVLIEHAGQLVDFRKGEHPYVR
jgi:hypothetical protein